jgi:hypothetical protein
MRAQSCERAQAAAAAVPGSREPLGDEVMLFVLEATKIDHHWSSLKQDGDKRRRILAPAVALADFRDSATKAHAEQIKEPLQSSNAHWPIVYCQLGGLDDLETYLRWGNDRVKVLSLPACLSCGCRTSLHAHTRRSTRLPFAALALGCR